MNRRTLLHGGLAAAAAGVATPAAGLAAALRGMTHARVAPASPHRARRHPTSATDDGVIRLNSNENALGIPESARDAILEGLAEANRYPLAIADEFRQRLAAFHGVPADTVVLGNGSTEALQMVVQAFARPGTALVVADPTFEDVVGYAAPFRLRLEKVPLRADHAHDLGAMRERARTSGGPALVYICNPNNPTASLTPSDEVEGWIRSAADDVVFLLDEAYVHYVSDSRYRSALELAVERPGVVVTRTFSKIYGLAGLRLGYAVAHPETAARVRAFAADVNANQLALRAAAAALEDGDYLERSRASNERARSVLEEALRELEIEWIPSHANFVMHRIAGELRDYIERMRGEGIRVGRPFPPMLGWNRLSLGSPAEMERFAAVLRTFRGRGWV